MSTDFDQYAAKFQEEMLKAVKQAQDANVAALQRARELFTEATSAGKPPMPEGLPTAAKAVELGFDYANKLLELQKQYALSIADIFTSAQKEATQATVRAAQAASNSTQKVTAHN